MVNKEPKPKQEPKPKTKPKSKSKLKPKSKPKPKKEPYQNQSQSQNVIFNINQEKPKRKYTQNPKINNDVKQPNHPQMLIHYNASAPMPLYNNPVPAQQTAFANAVQETARQVEIPRNNGIERPQRVQTQEAEDVFYTPPSSPRTLTPATPRHPLALLALQAPINTTPPNPLGLLALQAPINTTPPNPLGLLALQAPINTLRPNATPQPTPPATSILTQPPPATSILTQPPPARGFLADISTGAGRLRPTAPTAPPAPPAQAPARPTAGGLFAELLATGGQGRLRPTAQAPATLITSTPPAGGLNLTPSLLAGMRTGLRSSRPREEPTKTSTQVAEHSFTEAKSRLRRTSPVITPTVAPTIIPIIHLPTQQEVLNVQHQSTALETPAVENRLVIVSTNNRETEQPNETQNTIAREQERNKDLIARRQAETKLLRQHIAPQILGGTSLGNLNQEMIRQLRINALDPKENKIISIQPQHHEDFNESLIPEHQRNHDEEFKKYRSELRRLSILKKDSYESLLAEAKKHNIKGTHRGKMSKQEIMNGLLADFNQNPRNYY